MRESFEHFSSLQTRKRDSYEPHTMVWVSFPAQGGARRLVRRDAFVDYVDGGHATKMEKAGSGMHSVYKVKQG